MSDISFVKKATPANADAGEKKLYFTVGGSLASIDESGVIQTYSTGVTPEEVQDIVGSFITTSSSVQVTYNDVANLMQLDLIQSAVDHTQISSRGTNTHAQIDSHIANTSNPHGVTKAQVGLGNCDNTSDLNKPISTATQTALNAKENTIAAGTITQYWRGDKSWQTLDKASVGLGNVDNTSDLNKPISNLTQTALNAKENTISSGTTSQYWRGDKTWQTLDKNAVGLSNVPNVDATARANHTGTQTASTISDFASTTRGTVLTGVSFADASPVVATDTVLQAVGKLQAQATAYDVWYEQVTLADVSSSSAVTFTNLTELGVPVVSGKEYYIEVTMKFRSAATTTGIRLSYGSPDGAAGDFAMMVNAPIGNDGTGSLFSGQIINLTSDIVVTTGVQTTNTDFILNMKGSFVCTTGGTILPQFCSEVSLSQVTVRIGSVVLVREF
jgi:hypothetical protein